jgi:hypothetical protein
VDPCYQGVRGNGASILAIKESDMKKSYVKEETLEILVDIKLGDVAQLIDVLQDVTNEGGGSNNWKATDLLRKLKELRREAAEEARREFQSMLERT